MNKDIKLLHTLGAIAHGADDGKEYLLASMVLRRDGAIVISHNAKTKTPTPSCHAEARVLRKSDAGATLYVARVTRDGQWAIAKPCVNCQTAIRNKRVKRVYYTIGPNEYGIWDVMKDKNP
jgi:tRNA(Arg) A34 adenosine deaminase TadA